MYWSFWDPTYSLVLIGAVICAIASANVAMTNNKYSKIRNSRGLTGEEVARMILQNAGIMDVSIGHMSGTLTDHYSPSDKVLNLSEGVYGSTSISAVSVAAHECGHAIQHQVGYWPLKLRTVSVPVARFGSYLSWPLILVGLIFGWAGFFKAGIFFFLFVIAFQLITLPVEFDASHRAIKILRENEILVGDEMQGAKKMLTAAALTYVASLFSSILQLLRMILLSQRRSRD